MKKLLAFTSVAILTAGVAQAKTVDDYGPGMYEQDNSIEVLFDKLDLDNDGVVLNNEYTAMDNLTTEDISVPFAHMDLDGNGVITREEASEYSANPEAAREAYYVSQGQMEQQERMMKAEKKHYHLDIDHIDTDGAYKLNN